MNQSSRAKTTYLYLVRHGATAANEKRPYILQGSGIDLPLSPAGREQAAAVAQFLSGVAVEHVYASHLVRAVETAQAIAEHHDLDVGPIGELAECNVGRWEGMDWGSIMREHPEAYHAFMADPAKNPYLGGESYADVLDRAWPTIEQLLVRHAGSSMVIVAHNIVNRVILAKLLGLDLCRAKDIAQANACINVIRRSDGETELLTLNSFFHLDEWRR